MIAILILRRYRLTNYPHLFGNNAIISLYSKFSKWKISRYAESGAICPA